MDSIKEQRYAEDIVRGESETWERALSHLTCALSSWKQRPEIDIEDVIINSLWKAGKTYKAKRKSFINYAICICHRALCYEHRKKRIKTCEIDHADNSLQNDTPHINRMIAKEEVENLLRSNSNHSVIALLLDLGNTQAESARKMGLSPVAAHRLIVKIRRTICPV